MKIRTSITINKELLKELKKEAINQEKSVSSLLESIIGNSLQDLKNKKKDPDREKEFF